MSRLTIRAIRDEMDAAFDRLVRTGKLRSSSAAMPSICRYARDFYETGPEVFDELDTVKKKLQSIGRNVTQVARGEL